MPTESGPDFEQAIDITMQTYRQIASRYAQRKQPNNPPLFWQENLQHFVAYVQASPAWQNNSALPILDAGCGPGRHSLIFAQQGFNVRAIDLSEEMLAEARRFCLNQAGAERITFTQMDMRHLELSDASCAGVWASASFLHIPKRENRAALSELIRVLAPGGPLMMTVKEADGGADERFDPAPENGAPRFYARYHGGELWNLLEQGRLRVISINAWTDERAQGWLGVLAQKPE